MENTELKSLEQTLFDLISFFEEKRDFFLHIFNDESQEKFKKLMDSVNDSPAILNTMITTIENNQKKEFERLENEIDRLNKTNEELLRELDYKDKEINELINDNIHLTKDLDRLTNEVEETKHKLEHPNN